jgi:putative ABC transport system ATP-binding protein
MIELCGVHKTFEQGDRQVHALRGIDMTVDGPGFFAVMGPSGSGKSTLLHLLAGLDQADQGRVLVDGRDLARMGERELTTFRRRRLGIVFQHFNLIGTMTARENVALPGLLDGQPARDLHRRADALLDELGLADRASHRPDALSGGEQQRVAIARALLFDPPLLLADEPTGNLDSQNSQRLWQTLDEVASRHQLTVLMVTHEPSAAAHCSRVYVLRDGRVQGSFDVAGLDSSGVASSYQQLSR